MTQWENVGGVLRARWESPSSTSQPAKVQRSGAELPCTSKVLSGLAPGLTRMCLLSSGMC